MRKIYLLFIIAGITSINICSAQGLYIKAGVGYNFPITKTFYQDQVFTAAGTPISSSFKGVNLSKGVAPSFGIGYMFSKHVGFELAGIYTLGSNDVVNTTVMSGTTPVQTVKQTIHAKSLVLYPSIKLQTGIRGIEKIKLYTRSSLAIPILGYTSNKVEKAVLLPTVSTTNVEAKIYGNITVGLAAALGIDFSITRNASLWCEVNGQSLKVWAKKSKIDRYDVNGTSVLAAMTPYDKETNYVNTLNSSSNNATYNSTYSTSKPKEDIKNKEANFDAVGIAIGFTFKF
jgi:hypothetical protein